MMHVRKVPFKRRGSEATNVEYIVSFGFEQVIFYALLKEK
jgi:hypothetical protein